MYIYVFFTLLNFIEAKIEEEERKKKEREQTNEEARSAEEERKKAKKVLRLTVSSFVFDEVVERYLDY